MNVMVTNCVLAGERVKEVGSALNSRLVEVMLVTTRSPDPRFRIVRALDEELPISVSPNSTSVGRT
jgi:hypothetical protein